MIPKKLHYCWFGTAPKSDLIQFCAESWRKHCPDFELIEWNEGNFDLDRFPIAAAAFKRKKYAFVSDVARAHALYTQGGVYVDADVEIRRSLDPFLDHRAFTGFEQKGTPFTAVWGSTPGHRLARLVLEYYQHATESEVIDVPNTGFVKDILERSFGVKSDVDALQECSDGLWIYPSTTFCVNLPENYATHHFANSWMAVSLPTNWSHVVLASFCLDELNKLKAHGIKFSGEDRSFDAEIRFQRDLERLRWHAGEMVHVVKRRLRRMLVQGTFQRTRQSS
jgi:glycosyl transferase-like sugar-binding protein